jgi:2-methylcitrate dehydratase PrpD
VARILVRGSRATLDHVGWPYVPQGMTSAQLNLPYCIATLLLDGDAFVDQFTEDKVADPDRIRVASLVAVAEDPEITARGARYRHKVHVTVELRDGTRLEETVEAPRGSEQAFASADDVVGKFRKLASRRIASAQVDAIIARVMDAERMDSAASLVHLLTRAA